MEALIRDNSKIVNTVLNGDCLVEMQKIEDNSIDMVCADLPYANGITQNHWDILIPFEPLWQQYRRIAKDNAAIVLTANQPFTTQLVASNYEMFKYEWIWEKAVPVNFFNARKQPMRKHETVLVFCKTQTKYNPQGLVYDPKMKTDSRASPNYGHVGSNLREYTNYPNSILRFGRENDTFHPTQKPVSLFSYLIQTYTDPGDLVIDNCAGSGTTAVACRKTKRNYICIEKDPVYFGKIQERLANMENDVLEF